jgi:hypothetical protein
MSNPSTDLEFTHGGKHSKVTRYNWRVDDKRGELRELHKKDLHVDETYQRPENERKVQEIARAWSWIACGAIVVALRNGAYYVVDGGHRVLASKRRSDITTLPCIVFETSDIKEEAQGFLALNTLRKPVTSLEKFRALTVVGNESALAVKEILDKDGYVPMSYGGQTNGRYVKCISVLVRLYESNQEIFKKIWPLIVEVTGDSPVKERVIESLFYIEKRLVGTQDSLLRSPWRERVLRLGTQGILDACARACSYHAKGGTSIWADGVVNALNHGVRRRITIKEDD